MKKKKSPREYLEKYLVKIAGGCWLYLRPHRQDSFAWDGEKMVNIRRLAHAAVYPKMKNRKLYLKPACGNVDCINPKHQEIIAKRYLWVTKLTDKDIREIIQQVKHKHAYRKVGKRFNVSHQTIYNIVHGVTKVAPGRQGNGA